MCQARQDTDRNGKISVGYGMHGDTFGDRLDPFLVFGSGTGSLIDSFVARDDGNPFGGARGASIAADGTRMIYFRHGRDGDRIVIRGSKSEWRNILAIGA